MIQQDLTTNARIAVIGAGAAGLTAAYTLKQLGYPHVTVYEKAALPGGKVLTDCSLGVNIELGAVFATEQYELTLQLAEEVGAPASRLEFEEQILDEDGTLVPALQFATRKYGQAQLQSAVERYQELSDKYRLNERRGFAGLPAELHMPFAEFANRYGIVPVADLARCQFVDYGLPYYETVPAIYYLKGLDVILNIGPGGIRRPVYFQFPNGYQDLWVRLAKQLDVHCSSEITAVERGASAGGRKIEVLVNGERKIYDYVIIATPPSATKRFLEMNVEERDLFNQVVARNYHVTVAVVEGVPDDRRTVLPYAHTRPEAIGHVNGWHRPAPAQPVFASWQNVAWSQTDDEARQLLASDYATLGGGTLQRVLLHQAWDNFAHVETAALDAGFYERFEALQGKNGTLFATGLLALEGVEYTARYARDLVHQFFAPAAVSRQSAARGL